jgi:hypothetical protein
MNPRESDPTGAFSSGGAAGLEDHETEDPSRPRDQADSVTPGVDETEREVITSGTAATSEVGDRQAQDDAEGQGDGTPIPPG